jgi:ABC-type branched-subunit amino acid transport system substrate-binding protein
MNQPVFGTLTLLGENNYSGIGLENYENVILLTSVNWLGPKGLNFKREFQKKYDKIPGEVAAYAYDGMNIIIKAIRNSGFNRESVQKAMTNTHYEGTTGLIQFDDKGNRLGTSGLVEIKNGIPVKL